MFLNKSLLTLGVITLLIPLTLPLSSVTVTKQEQYPFLSNSLLAATNQRRIALIIGNSQYKKGNTLRNPVNDANDIAKALRELNFEVILVLDADKKQMDAALESFSEKLYQGGVGLFYYAGHGVQVNGENYLIPIDAHLNSEKDVYYETLPLGKILNAMEEARTNPNIIIIDACRDNPFSRRWNRSTTARGLAVVEAIDGSYIAFATAPGKTAADGTGKNGTFTSHLLQHLRTPNLSIEQLFKLVGKGVKAETNGRQVPWQSTSLTDDFSFNPVSETVATPTPSPNPENPEVATVTSKPSPSVTLSPSPNPENPEVATVTPKPSPSPNPENPEVATLTPPKPQPTPTTVPPSIPTTNLISYAPERITLERNLKDHSASVDSVTISPDGKTLVSGSWDNTLKIWNLETGKLKQTHYSVWVNSVAISPDGKTLVSGSNDKTIKIWNLATGELIRTLTGHSYWVSSVAISPDGKTLVSGSNDKTIKIWNLATGELIRIIKGFFVSTDKQLAAASARLNLTGSVTISPGGKTLVSGGLAASGVRLNLTGSVTISPDGKTLVSGSWDNDTIKIWNLATGKLVRTLTGHSDGVNSVAISPDGKTLISGSWDKTIKIWNLATGELIRTLTGHSDSVFSVAISPDGKTLVSSSRDATIKIWNLATGELIRTLTGHSDSVFSVAISPDGNKIIGGGGYDKGEVYIWQVSR